MAETETRTFRAATPAGELALQIREGPRPSASLILEGMFLIDSDSAESERALAGLGLEALRRARGRAGVAPTRVRVLVGGLGLGITLRALLELPGVGSVTVVEVFDPIVQWNRGPLANLNGGALEDPRVSCFVGDVREFLTGRPGAAEAIGPSDAFDLLLLDVDNGPTWLALPSNAWLYSRDGLEVMRARMTPHSVAAFWATERAPDFEAQLADLAWGEWSYASVRTPVRPGEPPLECFIYFVVRAD
jgi:spermidine synthase